MTMSMSEIIHPERWPEGIRWAIGGMLTVIGAIFFLGQIAGGITARLDNLNGTVSDVKKIVDSAVANQTTQHDLIVSVQSQIKSVEGNVGDIRTEQRDVKDALGKDHDRTSTAIELANKLAEAAATSRLANLPRLDSLEKEQGALTTDLALIKQKLDYVAVKADRIEATTNSHDADIKATRAAVAPRDSRPH